MWYDSNAWSEWRVVSEFRSHYGHHTDPEYWRNALRSERVPTPARVTKAWVDKHYADPGFYKLEVRQEYTVHAHRRWVMGFCSGTVEVVTTWLRNSKGQWYRASRRRSGGPT